MTVSDILFRQNLYKEAVENPKEFADKHLHKTSGIEYDPMFVILYKKVGGVYGVWATTKKDEFIKKISSFKENDNYTAITPVEISLATQIRFMEFY